MTRADLKEALSDVYDIERLTTRILYGSATPKEVRALGDTCIYLPQVRQLARQCNHPTAAGAFEGAVDPLDRSAEPHQPCPGGRSAQQTVKDGGAIRAGFNAEVDEPKGISCTAARASLPQLEAKLKKETGIPKLKIGFNKVFGYYIEVSRSYAASVPDTFIRKQTLTTGERYITPELKELENKILGANERLLVLEHQLFADLLEDRRSAAAASSALPLR